MSRVLLALLASAVPVLAAAPTARSQGPAVPPTPPAAAPVPALTAQGEILMLTGELCVVRDSSGKSTLLTMGKDTKVTGTVKVGDKVEAQMTADGRALSIKPLRR